ncbi:MAG: IS66 family insertion sequence element accessory protein TnpB [Pirellulaceae bacterium]
MLTLSAAVKIHVCVLPTDLRKGFDGLCGLAEHVLKQDPLSGHLFVFRSEPVIASKCYTGTTMAWRSGTNDWSRAGFNCRPTCNPPG